MTLVAGTMVFFVIWWIALFMVLPFGITMDENPTKGFDPSAPKHPNLKKKFLITTILTALIWGILEVAMLKHWFSFS